MPTFSAIIWFAFGLLIMRYVWKFGLGMLKSMTSTLPEPPPSGEMRRINVRYRCSVCGVEIRMVMAPDEGIGLLDLSKALLRTRKRVSQRIRIFAGLGLQGVGLGLRVVRSSEASSRA